MQYRTRYGHRSVSLPLGFNHGESLSKVIERAGGLTDYADAKAALFTRTGLLEREEEQLLKLRQKLELSIGQESITRST